MFFNANHQYFNPDFDIDQWDSLFEIFSVNDLIKKNKI